MDETHEKRRKALMSIFKYFKWNEISQLYDYEYFNLIEVRNILVDKNLFKVNEITIE